MRNAGTCSALNRGLILFVLVLASRDARAQFYGSVSTSTQTTSNVQSLDTTAPDRLLLPGLQFGYAWHPSPIAGVTFTLGYSPSFYSINTAYSYNAYSAGATALFYLSHQDDVRAEAMSEAATVAIASASDPETTKLTSSLITSKSDGADAQRQSDPSSAADASPSSADEATDASSPADSLVEIATGDLYQLSGELDSATISSKTLSAKERGRLSDLKDSISEAVTVVADLLDSIGYSESASEIIIPSLQGLNAPLANILGVIRPGVVRGVLLRGAIAALLHAKPASDFLSETSAKSSTSSTSPYVSESKVVAALPAEIAKKITESASVDEAESGTSQAPVITLLNSSTLLRDIGSSDLTIREDASDSSATTLASTFTVPVSYEVRVGQDITPTNAALFGESVNGALGNPNNYKTFGLGTAFESYPSSTFSYRLSYDFSNAYYPFDSVYSNTENRLRLGGRLGLGTSALLFTGLSLGLRTYLNPLTYEVNAGKKTFVSTETSRFTQYTFGLGIAKFFGERFVLGLLASFNNNPNLRGYVTQADSLARLRRAVQIADDEYTYNLSRYAAFVTSRLFWGLDLNVDLSYEHRLYGAAVQELVVKGKVVKLNLLNSKGRTENGVFFTPSLTKLIAFDNRALGVFQSVSATASLQISNVTSSDPLYSYKDTEFTFGVSLDF